MVLNLGWPPSMDRWGAAAGCETLVDASGIVRLRRTGRRTEADLTPLSPCSPHALDTNPPTSPALQNRHDASAIASTNEQVVEQEPERTQS